MATRSTELDWKWFASHPLVTGLFLSSIIFCSCSAELFTKTGDRVQSLDIRLFGKFIYFSRFIVFFCVFACLPSDSLLFFAFSVCPDCNGVYISNYLLKCIAIDEWKCSEFGWLWTQRRMCTGNWMLSKWSIFGWCCMVSCQEPFGWTEKRLPLQRNGNGKYAHNSKRTHTQWGSRYCWCWVLGCCYCSWLDCYILIHRAQKYNVN